MLSKIKHELLKLIFAELCSYCNNQLHNQSQVLCWQCQSKLPFTGAYYPNNMVEKTFWTKVNFNWAYALTYVEDNNIAKHIIHLLKYKNKPQVGIWLGELLGKELLNLINPNEQYLLLPIPLNKKREFSRGYNQSMYIAEGIKNTTLLPIANTNILRIKNTSTQTKKTRAERYENMLNAFELSETVSLQNKHIIIVDDVITTGATIAACATTLQKIGGVKVSVAAAGFAFNN
jgi:ComF family protein